MEFMGVKFGATEVSCDLCNEALNMVGDDWHCNQCGQDWQIEVSYRVTRMGVPTRRFKASLPNLSNVPRDRSEHGVR